MKVDCLALALIACLAASGAVQSQEPPPPVPKEPFRVETPARHEFIAIGIEDLEELELQLEQMRQRQLAARGVVDPQKRQDSTEPEEDAKGRRTIVIDVPTMIHVGGGFLFVDTTVRTGGHEGLPTLSMRQRREAVEAFRRSRVEQNNRK